MKDVRVSFLVFFLAALALATCGEADEPQPAPIDANDRLFGKTPCQRLFHILIIKEFST
jgi:hypothetical protein